MKDNFDKEAYKYYNQAAKEDNVKVGYSPDLDFTFAYSDMTEGPDCRMLAVAVSFKAPEDEWDRKTGKLQALLKLYGGEYVQLPLAQHRKQFGNAAVKEVISNVFYL